jgi:prefoldin subunit 5
MSAGGGEQLYVKGKLTNVEAVMIDIGTGYYIERVRTVNRFCALLFVSLLTDERLLAGWTSRTHARTTQTPQQAQEYVDRKLGLVQENAEKLQQALLTKRKNLEAIISVMQEKMANAQQ